MLKNRTVMLSLLLALIAATVATIYAKNMKQEAQKRADIVVAAIDIPAKAIITEGMLMMKNKPEVEIPSRAYMTTDLLIGKVARADISRGSMLLQDHVATREEMGMSFALIGNRRAISLVVDDVSGLGNILKVGDTVDVIAVFGNDSSKLLLQNIEIIGLGRNSQYPQAGTPGQPQSSAGKETAEKFVTLAMSPEQATKLALAEANGKLRFILRPAQLLYKNMMVPPVTVKRTKLIGKPDGETRAAVQSRSEAYTQTQPSYSAPILPPAAIYPADGRSGRDTGRAEQPKPTRTIEVIRGTQRDFVSLD